MVNYTLNKKVAGKITVDKIHEMYLYHKILSHVYFVEQFTEEVK